MRLIKLTAKDDWKGIFYIGWSKTWDNKKSGVSISFGKKVYLITK